LETQVCEGEAPAGIFVAAMWVGIPTSGVAETNSVTLHLENRTEHSVTVTPSLVAAGLDTRHAERSLEQVVLAAEAGTELSVDLGQVPLQSSTHSTQVHVRVAYSRWAGDVTSFLTEPLFVHYDPSYAQATVYSEDVMRTELGGGLLTEDPAQLEGRIGELGGWTALDEKRNQEWDEMGGPGAPPDVYGHWWGTVDVGPV